MALKPLKDHEYEILKKAAQMGLRWVPRIVGNEWLLAHCFYERSKRRQLYLQGTATNAWMRGMSFARMMTLMFVARRWIEVIVALGSNVETSEELRVSYLQATEEDPRLFDIIAAWALCEKGEVWFEEGVKMKL